MTLDLLITIALCAGSFIGGYTLRGHIHSVAQSAVQAVTDAANKVG